MCSSAGSVAFNVVCEYTRHNSEMHTLKMFVIDHSSGRQKWFPNGAMGAQYSASYMQCC